MTRHNCLSYDGFEEGDVEACADDGARCVACVRGGDGAVLGRDEPLGERQPDADARWVHLRALLLICAASSPVEALEHVGKVRVGDAWSGVRHANAAGERVLMCLDRHRSPGWRVLHAVLEYVLERFGRPCAVADEAAPLVNIDDEGDVGNVEGDGEGLGRIVNHTGNVDGVVGEGDDRWLRDMLSSEKLPEARVLARDALRAAAGRHGSTDDMTVLAVYVQERR